MNFPAKTLNSSELQVTTSRMTAWGPSAKKNFFCHVTHSPSSTSKNITVPVPRGNVTQPTVKLLHSSCDPTAFHPTIQLYCFIYDHIPGDVTVAWLKNGVEMPNIFPRDILLKEGKLASTYSELNITQQDWASESTFSCKIISQGETYWAHARKCADYEPRGVNTYLIPPSPLDLFILKTPKLICLVVDLESEDRVTVTWTQEHNNEPVGTASERVTKHVNATTSITSTLSVDAKDWIDGKGYRCIVKHPDLPKSIVRAITKAPGKRSAPKVYMFLPPEVEEDKRTLTCLIQNFFPVDISVQWLQNGKLVQNMPHSTTAPLKYNGANPAFFIFSRLEVTKEHWERNDQFTCRVIHEALPEPRTLEKTVSKSPGK